MTTFKMWWRVFVGKFLTDTLLLAFSFAWLILVVIPLLLAKQHVYGAWYDYNVSVLMIEVVVCVFASTWAIIRVASKIRNARKEGIEIEE